MCKKLKFIYIFKCDEKNETPLTYVKNLKQAKEYLYLYYLEEHRAHFNAWCECHNRPNKTWEDYCLYAQDVLEIYKNPDNIKLVPIWFTEDDIASLLRSITGNTPVGASYETEEERAFFNSLKEYNLTN